MSDGVVFREGGSIKSGGTIRPPGNSMTRREYVSMVEEMGSAVLNNYNTNTSQPNNTVESRSSNGAHWGRDESLIQQQALPSNATTTSTPNNNNAFSSPRSSSGPSSLQQQIKEHRQQQAALSSSSTYQKLPAWVTDARTIDTDDTVLELKDDNLELIRSPDWGQNPPKTN